MTQNYTTAKAFSLAAITALVAAAAFTSCNKDDDLKSQLTQSSTDSKAMTRSATLDTTCPANMPENQHEGAVITMNVANYGDAKFTCISSSAPYYFVHVSDREYSAKEMDAMHYQQNSYAPTKKTLQEIADEATKYVYHILGKTHNSGVIRVWSQSQLNNTQDIWAKTFGKSEGVATCGSQIYIQSPYCWIRDTENSYPYANIWSNAYTWSSKGAGGYEAKHHACYFTADEHRLIFCVVGNTK